eukprot:Skav215876  [mRNA]  locus=scaffold2770:165484:185595:- [translate_table: standard]
MCRERSEGLPCVDVNAGVVYEGVIIREQAGVATAARNDVEQAPAGFLFLGVWCRFALAADAKEQLASECNLVEASFLQQGFTLHQASAAEHLGDAARHPPQDLNRSMEVKPHPKTKKTIGNLTGRSMNEDREPYKTLNYARRMTSEETELMRNTGLGTRVVEGCTMRAAMSGVGGAVLGLLMGGFMHAMQPPPDIDTSLSSMEQIRQSYKGFGQACIRMSRNFAKVGVVYAGMECFLERERAARDLPGSEKRT